MSYMTVEKTWRRYTREIFVAARDEIFLVLAFVLVALAAFGLGRLSVALEGEGEFEITYPEGVSSSIGEKELPGNKGAVEGVSISSKEGAYVASKSGSKYHLPWCPGAQAIKEENKIWFETKEDAETA